MRASPTGRCPQPGGASPVRSRWMGDWAARRRSRRPTARSRSRMARSRTQSLAFALTPFAPVSSRKATEQRSKALPPQRAMAGRSRRAARSGSIQQAAFQATFASGARTPSSCRVRWRRQSSASISTSPGRSDAIRALAEGSISIPSTLRSPIACRGHCSPCRGRAISIRGRLPQPGSRSPPRAGGAEARRRSTLRST